MPAPRVAQCCDAGEVLVAFAQLSQTPICKAELPTCRQVKLVLLAGQGEQVHEVKVGSRSKLCVEAIPESCLVGPAVANIEPHVQVLIWQLAGPGMFLPIPMALSS